MWHHVGVVFSGSALTVFIDGTLVESPSSTDPLTYILNRPITLGCRTALSGPEGYFVGDLDDVRIYNRPLTSDEILELSMR